MNLKTQPYKGTRDFYPEEMRIRKWMFGVWREVCERFGYEEYDTPILEPLKLYASKTSDEIVNEQTYSFVDRGERKVVMRPEMTPSVSRIVAARRQQLAYPLRLYSIPNCFRYERPQKGRLREFWQLNADIFGAEGIEADVEVIMLTDTLMKAFGASKDSYKIKVNSRLAMNQLFDAKGFDGKLAGKYIAALDKVGKKSFKEYCEQELDAKTADKLLAFAEFTKAEEILKTSAGAKLAQAIKQLQAAGINVEPDVTINRGFDYYTDIVFEVFDTNPDNNRSMFGGGRYDGLVGKFDVDPVPTVGMAAGDATFLNFLKSNNLIPARAQATETDYYIVVIGKYQQQAQELAQNLRASGKKVAVDLSNRKPDKQVKSAEKKNIKQIIYFGEEEIKSGKLKIKNLDRGSETTLDLNTS